MYNQKKYDQNKWKEENGVYDQNHYFGLGPKPKSKLADTFNRYRNRYRNYILKGESSYQ